MATGKPYLWHLLYRPSWSLYHSHKGCFIMVVILIAAIILPLMLNFGSNDWFKSKWAVEDEKDNVGVKYTRSSSPAAYWEVIYSNRLEENRWEEGDGRGLTNDTWLPNDPVGLNAGRTPQTVPAATWNCLVSTRIAFNRLTLVFLLLPYPGKFTPYLSMLQKTPLLTGLSALRGCVLPNSSRVYCYRVFASSRENLTHLFF